MRDYKAISLKNVVLSYLSLLISEYFLFCGLKSPEGLNSGQVLLKYASKSGSSCTTTICHSFSKIFSYFSLCHITCWSLNSIVVLHNKVPWSPWNPLCFLRIVSMFNAEVIGEEAVHWKTCMGYWKTFLEWGLFLIIVVTFIRRVWEWLSSIKCGSGFSAIFGCSASKELHKLHVMLGDLLDLWNWMKCQEHILTWYIFSILNSV